MARHTETDVWGKGGDSGEHLFLSCDGAFPLDLRGVLVRSCLVPPRSQCAPTARQGRQGDCVLGTRRVSSRQLPVWPLVGRSTLCVACRRRRVLLCWTDWLTRPRAASGPGATHRAHLISPQGEANYMAGVSRRRPLGGASLARPTESLVHGQATLVGQATERRRDHTDSHDIPKIAR